ncbi:sigma-70 family RNA polymerase sigma factor [Streptomyces sp. NPDC021100]|uniref:sigma-70 family RNA polymerase sigma factor n=1 Tax=Streptomyces sp. NPDC021100 TaxID=3365114 RepID=UPI0037AD73DF
MMTSRYEQPPHAPGGSRPPHGAAASPRPSVVTSDPDDPPPPVVPHLHLSRVAPYLNGLYTYCLFLLREPDAATCALAEALALAERRADRAPYGPARPWLYALARWACRRRLAAGPAAPRWAPGADPLAWPEAAGTDAVQREALELSVRHGLPSDAVATVLRLEPEMARALLAGAACEVERTRTALAVVAAGRCQAVARFAAGGGPGVPLAPAARRELVRHVDECPGCRRTAERVTAGAPWPGTTASRAELPLFEAPLGALQAALRHARATRPGSPRYDREGFPLPPADRSGRRTRLRHRAVTTTVVATVAAAPALALWAAYRETPSGDRHGAESGEGAVTAGEAPADDSERPSRAPVPDPDDEERAADRAASREAGDPGDTDATDAPGPVGGIDGIGSGAGIPRGSGSPGAAGPSEDFAQPAAFAASGATDATVFTARTDTADATASVTPPPAARIVAPEAPAASTATPTAPRRAAARPAPSARPASPGPSGPSGPWPGFGRLTVAAQPSGQDTLVTVTAVGGEVHWAATPGAAWLRLGRTGGVLLPGRSLTFTVATDPDREPADPWRTQVRLAPGPATVPVDGPGRLRRTEAI